MNYCLSIKENHSRKSDMERSFTKFHHLQKKKKKGKQTRRKIRYVYSNSGKHVKEVMKLMLFCEKKNLYSI